MVRSGVTRTAIASAAWTRNADSVATVDTRGNVYVFHIRKNRYQLLAREGDEGTSVCVNDTQVFAGFVTGVIKVLDMDKSGDTVVATLKGHRSRVTHMELSPGNDFLLSTSNDAALLWDLTSGTYTKKNLSGGAYGCVQARFSGKNADSAVVAFHDESVWQFSVKSGSLTQKLQAPDLGARSPAKGQAPLCQSIAISSNGRYVVTAGGSPLLFVWDTKEGVILHAVELPGSVKTACDVELMAGSDSSGENDSASLFVAVACDDGAVRVVDVMNGFVSHTMVLPENNQDKQTMAEGLAVEPSGRYAAVTLGKGQMRLYDVHVARAQRASGHPLKLTILTDVPGFKKGANPPAVPLEHGCDENVTPNRPGFGPAPGTKPRLGKGRRGPFPGTASAPPASAFVGAKFDLPKPLSAEFLDVRNAASSDELTKLKDLLKVYGEFPDKYRLLTWRKVLKIPDNEKAYEALAGKDIHPSMVDLPDRFPISDRSLLLRLQRVCSCLAHYSPVFAESPVVPGMAFPFVKAFKTNEVFAFESFLVLINNHARGWFELFPDPPYGHLAEVEAVVKYHDPAVAKRMESVPGGLQGKYWTFPKSR